mgnify:CR=1 FL=1
MFVERVRETQDRGVALLQRRCVGALVVLLRSFVDVFENVLARCGALCHTCDSKTGARVVHIDQDRDTQNGCVSFRLCC